MNPPEPLKTFIIYARSDEAYKQQLLLHLRPLRNSRLLNVWHDGNILPGEDWEKAIKKELSSSDLVLMLVSAHSLNSEFIQGQELRTALDRLRDGLTRVVPVIVSPCGWRFDPVLAGLQALPLFGSEGPKPVNDRVWQNTDEAWANVVENLGNMAIELNDKRQATIDALAASAAEAHRAKEAEAQKVKEAEHQQAQAEAQKIKESEHQQAKAAAKRAQETETLRAKDAETSRLRAEQERERQWHEAHNAAWVDASSQHNQAAYEHFLTNYPNSPYARETRQRLKLLRQSDRKPIAWDLWLSITGGVIGIALVVWMLTTGGEEPSRRSHTIETTDTLRPKDPDPIPSQTLEGSKTISPEKLPENTGVKKDEPLNMPSTGTKPAFTFNYLMKRVAGGTFLMGSSYSEANRSNDECQHSVTVGAFGIGQTEVTQAQWKSVMGSNPSRFKGDNLPVENVSWNDAQAFIKKLNEKTGQNFRLPKEKEWEYAAQGGGSSRKTKYSGSDDISSVAWCSGNSNNTTHPVGTKKTNELGLYDMSGNVWEWCQDQYGPYPGCSSPSAVSTDRVLRGGSWYGKFISCRSANRNFSEPGDRLNYLGFRLAQD